MRWWTSITNGSYDMELYINTYGSYIRKKDEMFEVSVEGKRQKLAPNKISSIVISNAATISTDAIQLAMEHNIDIVFLDQYGDPYGRIWFPKIGSTVTIRRRQLEMLQNEQGLSFIKERIALKIMNQYRLLKKLISKRSIPDGKYAGSLERMWESAQNVMNAEGSLKDMAPSFMGWEGNAGKNYYAVLADLLPEAYRFQGRSSRPAKDAFNLFLNYGYGMLYSKVERALIIAGMDPYIGLLHSDNYNKKSFVFDFIEPYRIMVDEPVFYIFSRHKFKPEFLQPAHNGVLLTTLGKKFLAPILLEHFDSIIRHHNKNRKRVDAIQADAHAFANALVGKRKDYLDASENTRLQNFLAKKEDSDPQEEPC